jgi:Leucine Rich repeat
MTRSLSMNRPAFFLLALGFSSAFAAPENPAPASGKAIPLTDPSRFGAPQAQGEETAEMKQLQQAGIYQGQPNSLTFFRWKGSNPPVLFHLGLWGPQNTNQHAAFLPFFQELESIEIHEASFDDLAAQHLAKLPKLRRLTISPVDRYQKPGFTRMQWSYPWLPQVQNRPQFTGKALATLSALPLLDFLDLRDARVTSSELAALASFPKLSEVGLPNPIDAAGLQSLLSCKQLSAMILGNREVSASEIELLAKLPSLKRLTLRNARLSNETLAALAKLEKVTALSIYDCGLTDAQLAHLGKPPQLTKLELVRNEIKGPGLAHLASFSLQKLDLMFNNLSDASLTHLEALRTLEDLSIAYCTAVTDEGLRPGILQKMKHLQFLELRGLTSITDASLEALCQFGHLKQIGIREDKISWESVDKMRAAMPNTKVFK